MPQSFDRIDFICEDIEVNLWPKLSCGGSNLLDLAAGSLRLEVDRAILFQDNGQIRSFDDNHKLVFNRVEGLLELHETGAIRFLTGAPAPSERLRIQTDGNVGIGTAAPGAKLHVAGGLRTEGDLQVNGSSTIEGTLQVTVGINVLGSAQVQRDLQVNGLVNANDIRLNNAPLRLSQWEDTAGGINYAGGNVGIGVADPTQALEVNGAIKATDFIKGTTVLVSSQWTDVSGGINYAAGKVGIGTTKPEGNLQIAGPRPDIFLVGNTSINQDGLRIHYNETAGIRAGVIDVKGASLRLRGESGATGTGSTERLLIDLTTGNVGIGTATPAAKLQVAGGAIINGVTIGADVGGVVNYPWEYETVGVSHQNFNLRLQSPNAIIFHSGDALTDRMIITEGGAVGLGVQSPRTPLHVLGRIATGLDFSSAGAVTFYPPDGFAWFHIDNGPAGGRPIGRLRISYGGNPGDRELMTFLQNETIGIGTATPAVKLHVVGNRIRLTKVNNAQHFLDLRADGGALDIEAYGGDLYINNTSGTFTRIRNFVNISSREIKERITDLLYEEADALLTQLRPVKFQFKEDPSHQQHLGFIAEDVPAIVATPDQKAYKPTDLLAILTSVVQEQQTMIGALRKQMVQLEAQLAAQ